MEETIIGLISDRGNDLWEEHCTLTHLIKNGNDELWYIIYLYDFFNEHRNKNDLSIRDCYLLKREQKYVFTAHISVLEMWHSRFVTTLQGEQE